VRPYTNNWRVSSSEASIAPVRIVATSAMRRRIEKPARGDVSASLNNQPSMAYTKTWPPLFIR
jgi:hypothetical protein